MEQFIPLILIFLISFFLFINNENSLMKEYVVNMHQIQNIYDKLIKKLEVKEVFALDEFDDVIDQINEVHQKIQLFNRYDEYN